MAQYSSNTTSITIGERIKALRNTKELSQAALAKLCNISQQTIGAIESERVTDPRHLPAIASVLSVSVEYLKYGRSKGVPIIKNDATSDYLPRPGVDVPPGTKMLQIVNKYSQSAFAFQLDDDACSQGGIKAGDFVAVDHEAHVKPGAYVCVRYKRSFTVRRFRESGTCFISEHEDYASLSESDCELIGPVIQVVRTY